ncbi:MAG: hypothetical protein ABR976_14325, partial [Terracidiphilus sp.]
PHFHRRDDHEQYMKTSPKETSEDARIKHPLQAHSWIGKDSLTLVQRKMSLSEEVDSNAR